MMGRIFALAGVVLTAAACTVGLVPSTAPTAAVAQTAAPTPEPSECNVGGIELFGKVRIVERGGDVRVKMVEHFADLRVDPFSSFPRRCGEWQFVERREDFTIRFVEDNADIEIELVRGLPGMR